jgi:alpha-beta hydrolase superfamily lysophospholipase
MERLGAVVTVAPFPGFDMMMRDPHSAELPVAAIRGMVDWLGGMRTGHDRVTGAFVPAAPAGVHEPGTARKEQPFFTDQGRLFGVLTRPAVPAGRPAIILANAGAIHRIGPNRLHVTLARAWTELGFPVLRLDLGGLGDSPPVPGMPENEPYSARAVADIGEAVAALRSAGEAQGIVVAGLCAGAHAAFHAARQLRGIVGVLLINPIVLYWTPSDALEVPPWMMQHRVKWYGKSAMRFASWGKLLRGHVDIFSAVETVSLWARDRTAAGVRALKGRVDLMASGQVGRDDVEQDLVSLCGRGVDVALLFSRGDPGFDNLGFSDASRLRRLTQLHNFAHYEVPLEGHTFATLPAQRMLVETLTSHLQQRFGKRQ